MVSSADLWDGIDYPFLGAYSRHLMGWIEFKSIGLGRPYFADVFEGGEALGGLQPPPITVGIDEVVEVRS